MQILQLAKLAKVLRIVHVFKLFEDNNSIIKRIGCSKVPLFWTLIMFFVSLYIFALVIVQVIPVFLAAGVHNLDGRSAVWARIHPSKC